MIRSHYDTMQDALEQEAAERRDRREALRQRVVAVARADDSLGTVVLSKRFGVGRDTVRLWMQAAGVYGGRK